MAVCIPKNEAAPTKWTPLQTSRPLSSIARDGALPREIRMTKAIREIDEETDHHPHDQTDPGVRREAYHHVSADQDSERGYDGHHWGSERSWNVRPRIAQDHHAEAHDHERQQGADRNELTQ